MPIVLLHPLHGIKTRVRSGCRWCIWYQQRRWWFDPDATRKAHDKPAVVGTKYIFIKSQVPVVLLQTIRGVGTKGQIVHVRRGYARHVLVPKGLAAFGTWENIDAFADPTLIADPTLKARAATERGQLPFDWVGDVRLRFVRPAREDQSMALLEPVSKWDVLEDLSTNHELDLLPGNLDIPDGGLNRAGLHEVAVSIPFRNPETAAGKYTILVDVISKQSQDEELQREEMKKAVEQGMSYKLVQRGGAVQDLADEDDAGDEEEFVE
ncbi:rplI [Symbiodinium necroappetens]|uniref:RplI protein n=1 Tax=Symbiodinium necroappetens TaxID=1628268 RepID=A0A812T9T0_9DINO|nr:rplI [Symbiodinium necroappetens]